MSWYKAKDAEKPVLPEGEYEAVLEKATSEISKTSGARMKKLQIRAYGPDFEVVLFDYLVASAAWKIKDFAVAVGELKAFEAEQFDPADQLGSTFSVTLKIVRSDEFGSQNKIKMYGPSKMRRTERRVPSGVNTHEIAKANASEPAGSDDDIVVPF